VIATLITAAVVRVMVVVMVKEGWFATYRTSRIVLHLSDNGSIRCELMIAVTAEIFLKTVFIFAETIKRVRIVALRTFK
jgi:hypothetical protein